MSEVIGDVLGQVCGAYRRDFGTTFAWKLLAANPALVVAAAMQPSALASE
jgi:hypothetical protein